MDTIITAIGKIVKAIFVGDPTAATPVASWISQVVNVIISNDLILLAVIIPVTGLAVGMFKRLLSARA